MKEQLLTTFEVYSKEEVIEYRYPADRYVGKVLYIGKGPFWFLSFFYVLLLCHFTYQHAVYGSQ
jgi:hypothetical protein